MSKKIALVTGVSRGIGKAMVEALKEQSYTVVGCARKKEDALSSGVDRAYGCDVSRSEDVDQMLSEFKSEFSELHVLVNNAGLAFTTDLSERENDENWLRVIDVNLNGPYFVTKRFLPLLKPHARIINVSSVLGLRAVPASAAYCAAKFGLIGFTKSMAIQLAPKKITVNAICPGWVDTEMAAERLQAFRTTQEEASREVPMGRFLKAEEIAAVLCFLCSDAAAMITGETLRIDGGSFI